MTTAMVLLIIVFILCAAWAGWEYYKTGWTQLSVNIVGIAAIVCGIPFLAAWSGHRMKPLNDRIQEVVVCETKVMLEHVERLTDCVPDDSLTYEALYRINRGR